MGMSKKIWMAQSELDHVNQLINMDADDYWDAYIDEKDMDQLLQKKAVLEKELKELTGVAVKT
tara:strand:+ start:2195 stop:2383 length:189 start_codon:yes stop_codon:yes gene_type:complete